MRFIALVAMGCCASALAAAERVHQRENVLGTSFEMTMAGVTPRAQEAVVAATLAEVSRLEKVLSTWRNDSELSRLNASREPSAVSPDLANVLRLCEDWRVQTGSAFSCRIGSLIGSWRSMEGAAELPDRAELRKNARALDRLRIPLNSPLTLPAELQWNVDAIAKGYVLDRAMEVARRHAPKATGIRIDIGGDALYWGGASPGQPWRVAVADPRGPRDNDGFLTSVELRGSIGIASSGHRSRGVRVANQNWSHIIDPREGWPAQYAPAATVIARDAATADALATALSVLPVRNGLDLIERIPGAHVLLVSDSGRTFASSGWYDFVAADLRHDPAWLPGFEFVVDYEIPEHAIANYRRPYVAIWIADSAHQPLRQLLLLGESERWMQEVRTWWRRAGRLDEAAIDGIVRPTRRPGSYSLLWDGRDDQGRGVAAGEYLLCIEAARERGERELLELPIRIGQEPFALKRTGAKEVGSVAVRFVPANDSNMARRAR